MEFLRQLLLLIHLIGFALLLGGFVTQYLSGPPRINAALLWGSAIQLVSGAALASPIGDDERPAGFLIVKTVVALMIAVMVWVPRRRPEVNRGHFIAIGVLTLANAAVAVFWH